MYQEEEEEEEDDDDEGDTSKYDLWGEADDAGYVYSWYVAVNDYSFTLNRLFQDRKEGWKERLGQGEVVGNQEPRRRPRQTSWPVG